MRDYIRTSHLVILFVASIVVTAISQLPAFWNANDLSDGSEIIDLTVAYPLVLGAIGTFYIGLLKALAGFSESKLKDKCERIRELETHLKILREKCSHLECPNK